MPARISWLIDAHLFGVEARAFHTTSLLLHVVDSILLLFALSRLTGEFWPSAYVTGVFAGTNQRDISALGGQIERLANAFFLRP